MHRLSMVQALSIWSDLETAYRGESGFGGHVTEIYVYRCQPNCPTASHPSSLGRSAQDLQAKFANQSLQALLDHFAVEREALVEVETPGGFVGTDFLGDSIHDHRWHIRVMPVERPNPRKW